MARKRASQKSPTSSLRRFFVIANLLLWGLIGGWYLFQTPVRQAEVSRLVGNCFDSRKHVTAFDVAWDLWQLYYSSDYVASAAVGRSDDVYGGVPTLTATASVRGLRMLKNPGYETGYSDEMGNPLWTAYHVRDGNFPEPPPRPAEFSTDGRTVARVDPGDYSHSGYDRGHMAPNYAIAVHYGQQAQEATFLMSNICPQKHALNAGPWKDLEQRIAANYPARFGEVWVLAGPVFSGKPAWLRRRVAVPEGFYMILVDENEGRMRTEAFLFPQDTPAGAKLDAYLTAIDEIERRTGLDFFSDLPEAEQASVESRVASRVW